MISIEWNLSLCLSTARQNLGLDGLADSGGKAVQLYLVEVATGRDGETKYHVGGIMCYNTQLEQQILRLLRGHGWRPKADLATPTIEPAHIRTQ